MSPKRPYLLVFAGANGSGKSTVVDWYLERNMCAGEYICPDQLVPKGKQDDLDAYIDAMRRAERRRNGFITTKTSFTFETVLSTREKLDFINYAKAEGYIVTTIYVVTSDPQINVERIKQRTAQGGHGVPHDKILSRYKKSMSLMEEVIDAADEALVYDNSGAAPIVLYAKYMDGRRYHIEPFTEWLKPYLIDQGIK